MHPDKSDNNQRKKNRKLSKSSKNNDDVGESEDASDNEYLFLCNRWLAKNEDDGEIVRELVPNTKSELKRRNTLSGKAVHGW